MHFHKKILLIILTQWKLQWRRLASRKKFFYLCNMLLSVWLTFGTLSSLLMPDDTIVYSPKEIANIADLASITTIGFTPAGKGVRDFMSHVSNNLNVADNASVTLKDFADERAMEDYNKLFPSEFLVGVTFHNVSDDGDADLPKDLRLDVRRIITPAYNTEYEDTEDVVVFIIPLLGDAFIKYWMSKNGDDPNLVKYEARVKPMASFNHQMKIYLAKRRLASLTEICIAAALTGHIWVYIPGRRKLTFLGWLVYKVSLFIACFIPMAVPIIILILTILQEWVMPSVVLSVVMVVVMYFEFFIASCKTPAASYTTNTMTFGIYFLIAIFSIILNGLLTTGLLGIDFFDVYNLDTYVCSLSNADDKINAFWRLCTLTVIATFVCFLFENFPAMYYGRKIRHQINGVLGRQETCWQNYDGRKETREFEAEPEHLKVGIEFVELTKELGKSRVVDRLSLKLFEGQITVLLGHSGAGKSTTLSMLSGSIVPTSGTAIVNGYDVTKDAQSVRDCLGLGIWKNTHFREFTVKEQLLYFAQLKGETKEKAEENIWSLLTDFGLNGEDRVKHLSGGQKKKFSVAYALITGTKAVILDSPTSGIDRGARRQVWRTLQKYRKGRTVVLATQDIEEAEMVGDRIVIMMEGVVKCCGSFMFLKNVYGVGNRLDIYKEPSCDVTNTTNLITSHIVEAKLNLDTDEKVTYFLPDEQKSKTPELFRDLEEMKKQLRIRDFWLSANTMEEIYFKDFENAHKHPRDQYQVFGNTGQADVPLETNVAGPNSLMEDASTSLNRFSLNYYPTEDVTTGIDIDDGNTGDLLKFSKGYKKCTRISLALGKMREEFVRKVLHARRDPPVSLIFPLLMLAGLTAYLIIFSEYFNLNKPSTLDLADDDSLIIPTTDGVNSTIRDRLFGKKFGQQFGSQEIKTFDVSKYGNYDNYLLKLADSIGIHDFLNRVVMGLEIEGNRTDGSISVISHYNKGYKNAKEIGVNYMMNALVRFHLNDSYSFKALEADFIIGDKLLDYVRVYIGSMFIQILFAWHFLQQQKVRKKLVQVFHGARTLTYCVPDLVFGYVGFLIISIPMNYVFFFDTARICPGVAFFHLLMHGLSVTTWWHAVVQMSPLKKVSTTVILKVFSILIMAHLPVHEMMSIPTEIVYVLYAVFPWFNLKKGLQDINTNYYMHQMCQDVTCDPSMSHPCCKGHCGDKCVDNVPYLAMARPGIGSNILISFITGVICFGMFIVVYYFRLYCIPRNQYQTKVSNTTHTPDVEGRLLFSDTDVAQEKERIENNTLGDLTKNDFVVLKNLCKEYKSRTVVDDVSLCIPRGECFVVLGKNGAGKTTIMKMMAEDENVTGGQVYIGGKEVCSIISKVQTNMGYCPQTDDHLCDYMTGREILTMCTGLRGVPKSNITDMVNDLLDILLLTSVADKRTGAYSQGNKRMLSVAISLVGMPDLILLDEPSTGMDLMARKRLWEVLSQVKASGCTLIVNSHSVEECEALCTRLAIMKEGKLVCLGSFQHIKAKYAKGYTMVVYLEFDENGSRPLIKPIVNHVSRFMPGVKVLEELCTCIHFQTPGTPIKLSKIFDLMESVKKNFSVKDYSVHHDTLEPIFRNLTRV